jgi:hypothetical protein
MQMRTRILTVQDDGYFAPFTRWQEYLRRLCAERQAALPAVPFIWKHARFDRKMDEHDIV